MTILSRTLSWRPVALPSLRGPRLRSLGLSSPLRRPAGIAIARRSRTWARAPEHAQYPAPSYNTNSKDLGSVVGQVWSGVVVAGSDRVAQLPRAAYGRAAIFCLGAFVAFVLATIVRKVLILLTFRAGDAFSAQGAQHDLQAQGSRSNDQMPVRGEPYVHQASGIKSRQKEGDGVVKKEHASELLDMAEVMQHAAKKVSVMQQVVDAAKGRLQEEMERSRCLEDEAALLKTQLASLGEDNQRVEQQRAALESRIQRLDGGTTGSSTIAGSAGAEQQDGAVDSEGKALNALLFMATNERDQLATVLSASEERGSSLQSQLSSALKQVSESEQASRELKAQLEAAEAEKRHLKSQVEALTSQQALAQDESAQRDGSINLLQMQLAQMKQQMDASSTALQALEDGSLGHGSPAESTRLNSLKDELAHVRLEKTAADEATQQAVQKFSEYERGIVKCVSDILEGKAEGTVKDCSKSAEAWWGLPDSQLDQFLSDQQVRLREATSQKEAIWNKMTPRAKQNAERLEQDVQDAIHRTTEQAAGDDPRVLAAQLQRTEGKLRAHLQRNMSSDHFTTYEALASECVEVEQRSADLNKALEFSVAERMLQLLAQQMSALQQAAAEGAQVQAARDAEAREMLKVQSLAKELAQKQNVMEEQEMQLLQRQEELDTKSAAAQEHDSYIQDLAKQTEQKSKALSAQELELKKQEETLKKRESRLVGHMQRLDAQIQREAQEEVQQAAAGDQTADAADLEASRSQVQSLQEELKSLKEMYSRQFVASKQELDAAQARIQQLRRQMIRPHNGVAPPTDGGAELDAGEAPDAGSSGPGGAVQDSEFSAWASELITKVSLAPPDMPVLDSEPSRQPSAVGVSERDGGGVLHSATSTLERETTTTTTEEEEEALPEKVEELRLDAVGFCVPHPAKVERGGEDAHFVLGSSAIGVADGVGGWCKSGVDPGEYSSRLMQYAEQAIARQAASSCVDALEYAHDRVNVPGSCTAIVAKLRSDSTLEIANLGDSGLRIVRDGQIAFATESLQHGFNMPFQLGNKNLIPYTDVPKSSLQSVVTVQSGDVIVMASDGFFDNVWDEDLARLVKHSCLLEDAIEEDCVANMAEQLALVAASNSQDKMFRSPWSVECAKQSDSVGLLRKLFPRGGKVDDITVVLARVE